MHKLATLLVLAQCLVFASSVQKADQKFTVYAGQIQTHGNLMKATDGVVIYNDNSTFSSNSATYHLDTKIVDLDGNVTLFYDGKIINKTDQMSYSVKNQTFQARDVFLQDMQSDIWVKSKSVLANKENYILKTAALSSCAGDQPDWQIKFSTAKFHKKYEYMSLYNPRFYLGKVPVLYLPWFAFPTNKDRKSGLLRPTIGFENSENLLIMQPYFIAPYKSWDIELVPQIRLDRGMGLYSTLRFADTAYSKGWVRTGFFQEKSDYVNTYNLKNSVHKGVEVHYENNALFTKYIQDNPYSYKDGLFVDATTLNDIDYVNLRDDNKYAVDKLITSKINYYISGYQDYFGAYARYFIDTEKLSNADTLQTLPSLQYHKFSQIFSSDKFLYSFDYKFKNSYRREGLRANQHEFSLPFIFNMPLLDNLINLSISENLYYSRVDYFEDNAKTENANYFSNYHKISLDTDLMKQYPSVVHNVQATVSLNLPSLNRETGYFADFIPFNLEKKSAVLNINNYLYTHNGYNFLIDRFSQKYFFEEEDEAYNEAENEVIYRHSKNLTLRNSLIYSYTSHKLKKIQTGLKYKDDSLDLRLDHTYQNAPNETKINYLSTDFTQVLDRKYALYGGIDYDLDDSFTKEWRIGLDMKKKCWSYQLRYKESVTPSLTSGGTQSITKRGIYLLVQFAHIGGVNYQYVKNFNTKTLDNTINTDDVFTETEQLVKEPSDDTTEESETDSKVSKPEIEEESIPAEEEGAT